tara:strand:- start:8141 stop:8764 length:624 start_codon:yes stop_codon:yes gene_type:complete
MQNHPSIRYVTQGDVFSIDTFPFPQYPLGNVIITNATFDGKSTDYGVQIVVADKIKLKDNESSGSNNQQTIYFEGVDDTVDIHANTLSIVNDLLSYTDRKEEGFEIQGTTACTAFKQEYDNGLAGWSADFTLRVHNDRNICLFDLGKSTTQECIRFTFGVLGGDPVIIEYRDCNGDVQYQYDGNPVCGLEVISLSSNTVIGSQQPCE